MYLKHYKHQHQFYHWSIKFAQFLQFLSQLQQTKLSYKIKKLKLHLII